MGVVQGVQAQKCAYDYINLVANMSWTTWGMDNGVHLLFPWTLVPTVKQILNSMMWTDQYYIC